MKKIKLDFTAGNLDFKRIPKEKITAAKLWYERFVGKPPTNIDDQELTEIFSMLDEK